MGASRVLRAALGAAMLVLVVAGCSGGAESTAADGGGSATDPNLSTVAQAAGPEVAVFAEPGGTGTPIHVLANPTAVGGPLVFLVDETRGDWLEVLLPVRPNGSTGWIKASDVTLSSHTFHIDVSLSTLKVTVFDGDEVILEEPVGIGTADTPTPGGRYYTKELLQPPDPNGRLRPVRLRPVRVLRAVDELRRRRGRDRPARHERPIVARTAGQPRLHPDVERGHHQAGRDPPPGSAGRDPRLGRWSWLRPAEGPRPPRPRWRRRPFPACRTPDGSRSRRTAR